MVNIDYLDTVFSASLSLRKVKRIVIIQETKNFILRPQIHPMLVSPFGTGKSAIMQLLEKNFEKDIYTIDDFTKASIEGSISKDGEYVPSVLMNVGGKMFVIDEWNNVDFYGQKALLGLLENQRSKRSLGFRVKHPFSYQDKHIQFKIEENIIMIQGQFSCLAFAMEYPIYESSQQAKALLSRFSPLFIEPNPDFIKAVTKGEFEILAADYGQPQIEEFKIPKNVYFEFHKQYYNHIETNDLYPIDSDDLGFISRTMSEIIRYGCWNYLRQHKNEKLPKRVVIDDVKYFVEMFKHIYTILLQFTNPKTKDKIYQYKKLKEKEPGMTKEQYADKMGVSKQTIYNYEKKLEKQPV